MISQMAIFMPAEALGFLPHREATEIWLQLQGQIELMLTLDEPFCGLSLRCEASLQPHWKKTGLPHEQTFRIS